MRIENVKIYTMDEGGIIPCGFIEAENGKISAIGEFDGDGSGGMLFPGFIDGHTHLGMCEDSLGFEGEDTNEMTDPSTPQLRAIDAINPFDRAFKEAREGGVTCCATGPGSANPIGGQFAAIKTYGRRIDDMVIEAPIMMKFALGENPKTVYHGKSQMPETRMATAAVIRENLMKARKYAEAKDKAAESKIKHLNDPDEDELDGPDYDMKLEALEPVVRGQLTAHFHAHRADDIFTAVRIAKEFGLKYSIAHCTDGHLVSDILASEGVSAFVGPNLCDRSKPELKDLSFENPGALDRAGVKVGIITDHPVIPLQYLPLCASLAVKSGMDEYSALKAITINPAEILGISDRVGSLKAGKDADMVLMSGSPFEIMSKIKGVWINGEQVK